MELILLEKIQHLGNLGDKVSVRPGYARNHLIPRGKAVPVTDGNLKEFEASRAELERTQADLLARAQARADQLAGLTVVVAKKVGTEDKLYGSVGSADIVQGVNDIGMELSKQEIRLPQGSFRHTGEYEVDIHLHADVDTKLKLHIVAED
ncbi:MAG: 50S ribosomal protein L9 [Gammaproteobacteria bacterium]|nr:50S ribosomal protein L9 [Gammaproteobacteria bacterium]